VVVQKHEGPSVAILTYNALFICDSDMALEREEEDRSVLQNAGSNECRVSNFALTTRQGLHSEEKSVDVV
jgi:hypothetical protein